MNLTNKKRLFFTFALMPNISGPGGKKNRQKERRLMKGTFTQHGKKKKLCLLLKKGTQYSVFGHFDVLPSTDMLSMGKTIIIIEESLCATTVENLSH